MGNTTSSHIFLTKEVNWEDIQASTWRSERSRELDLHGGPGRPAVRSGNSFSARVEFLGKQLLEKSNDYQMMMDPKPIESPARKCTSTQSFRFNTERRANERLSVPAQVVSIQAVKAGIDEQVDEFAALSIANKPVAAWRKRMHKSRRRVFLIVITILRLKRGTKHPKRMPKLEDLGLFIPIILGPDIAHKFAIEQRNYRKVCEKAELVQVSLEGCIHQLGMMIAHNNNIDMDADVRISAHMLNKDPIHMLHNEHLPKETEDSSGGGVPSLGNSGFPTVFGAADAGKAVPQYSTARHNSLRGSSPSSGAALLPSLSYQRVSADGRPSPGGPSPMLQMTTSFDMAGHRVMESRSSVPLLPSLSDAGVAKETQYSLNTKLMKKSSSNNGNGKLTRMPSYEAHSKRTSGDGDRQSYGQQIKRLPNDADRLSHGHAKGHVVPKRKSADGKRVLPDMGNQGKEPLGKSKSLTKASSTGKAPSQHKLLNRRRSTDEERQSIKENRAANVLAAARASVAAADAAAESAEVRDKGGLAQEMSVDTSEGSRAGGRTILPSLSGAFSSHRSHCSSSELAFEECDRPSWSSDHSLGVSNAPLPVVEEVEGHSLNINMVLQSAAKSMMTFESVRLQAVWGSSALRTMSDGGVSRKGSARSFHLTSARSRRSSLRSDNSGDMAEVSANDAAKANNHGADLSKVLSMEPSAMSSRSGPGAASLIMQLSLQHDRNSSQHAQMVEELNKLLLDKTSLQKLPTTMLGSLLAQANQLSELLEEQATKLTASSRLLNMYINRCNCSWTNQQTWSSPKVTPLQDMEAWLAGDTFAVYKADAARKLRQGEVALEIFCNEDVFPMPDGSFRDLWQQDPWDLVESCRPGIMPTTDRLEGVSLGSRIVFRAVQAVKASAGVDALSRLNLVLHLHEEQEAEMAKNLLHHNFYGLLPQNVILIVQYRQPGYRYNFDTAVFSKDFIMGVPRPTGNGHCLSQMAWTSEAFSIQPGGEYQPLNMPVFELLEQRKVQWVISRRSRDLALCTPDSAIDPVGLAYCLQEHYRSNCNMVLEVLRAENLVTARQMDSVVLQRGGTKDIIGPLQSSGNTISATSAQKHSILEPSPVVEIRHCALNTQPMLKSLEGMMAGPQGCVYAGLNRCTYHLSTMKSMLSSFAVFRPKLLLREELVHISIDMADLTSAEQSCCVAVESRNSPGILVNAESLDALIPILQAQDHDNGFREEMLRCTEISGEMLAGATVVSGRRDVSVNAKVGRRAAEGKNVPKQIIVFVTKNTIAREAIQMAVNIARPGQDRIHLVTFVASELLLNEGENMLKSYFQGILKSMVDIETHVRLKGVRLLDSMQNFVAQMKNKESVVMVVMGSVLLTTNAADQAFGSVTLSMIRKLPGVPVVVVTANSKKAVAEGPKALRMMSLVEGHSRRSLDLMCQVLYNAHRGDKLILGQVHSKLMTRQQVLNAKSLVEQFSNAAHGWMVPIYKAATPEGPFAHALCKAVEEHGVRLVGVQLPTGMRSTPANMVAFLSSCKAAVMVLQGESAVHNLSDKYNQQV